ncbi:carbamoyltransferase HypF [Barnesiella propionica]|uniref:carbamoyltransferase HypF n=1 Tax=Barnesiella propionica TaxID=2981781 RepID=UPI0011CBA36D|nr:carbamoyltransferase HypF [Barnesiella propionica]MCU6767605.1 carbamoyltransferase HypF [Barnesiella propionica]
MTVQYHIHIRGLVQGVGFRPYIYRLASKVGARGYVDNCNDGVFVLLQADEEQKESFLRMLDSLKPKVSSIESVEITEQNIRDRYEDFFIAPSFSEGNDITRVSPDIAVCEKCLEDRNMQPHRYGYPFINCTHCGPRFSIIRDLPYDRSKTTMDVFEMCPQCESEYKRVSDRRFHAQPVACNHCGPCYTLLDRKERMKHNYPDIVADLIDCLLYGGIIAIKGTGGYNLLCNAKDSKAVSRLRILKGRYAKPFAVMFRDTDAIRRYMHLSVVEEQSVTSWRRPIVLLREQLKLNKSLNEGLHTLGVMLPNIPVHYDLFSTGELEALVVTSANRGGDPMLISDELAKQELMQEVDRIVSYNREIYNRVDDSIIRKVAGEMRLIRRARGFTPEPVNNDENTEGIFAAGAHIISTFSLGKGEQIISSQYIGSLESKTNRVFYEESAQHLFRLFRFRPRLVVCDMHPGYYSSAFAEGYARQHNIPLLKVQHHHAHAVAVMSEYHLFGDVLALCLDGTGYGEDGNIWGGELFRCSRESYERLCHLPYLPLPGGDAAIKEPWRMAVSLLYTLFGKEAPYPADFKKRIGDRKIMLVERMIERSVNSPLSSGMGRVFDAVASLLGVTDINYYQAEAPLRLEHLAADDVNFHYPLNPENSLDFKPVMTALLEDYRKGVERRVISAAFHRTIAAMWLRMIRKASETEKLKTIVLSGGVMQNNILSSRLVHLLKKDGFRVYLPSKLPCNDAAVSVGQLACAAALYHS